MKFGTLDLWTIELLPTVFDKLDHNYHYMRQVNVLIEVKVFKCVQLVCAEM